MDKRISLTSEEKFDGSVWVGELVDESDEAGVWRESGACCNSVSFFLAPCGELVITPNNILFQFVQFEEVAGENNDLL